MICTECYLGLCWYQVYRDCDARPWETLVAAEKQLCQQFTLRWTVSSYRTQGCRQVACTHLNP